MRNFFIVLLVLSFALTAPVFAAQDAGVGAIAKSADKASQDTWIDQAGDWFATLGKSEEDREFIITQRRADRFAQRVQTEAGAAARDAEKAGDQAAKDIGAKLDSFKLGEK